MEEPLSPGVRERFWSRVEVGDPDECWIWRGSKLGPFHPVYGMYGGLPVRRGSSKRQEYAHRVAFELEHGHPGRWFVCHRCDVPLCVNPRHLFLGTSLDNVRDSLSKGRGPWSLTAADVRRMRELRERGWTQRAIAGALGVTQPTVSMTLLGKIHREHRRVSPAMLEEIRRLREGGSSVRRIKARFNVGQACVYRALAA